MVYPLSQNPLLTHRLQEFRLQGRFRGTRRGAEDSAVSVASCATVWGWFGVRGLLVGGLI